MKAELPFDEICVSADSIVLRLNGEPMARWLLPEIGNGDFFSLAGIKGSVPVTMATPDRENEA